MSKSRNFLHPLPPGKKFKLKNYQRLKEGLTTQGVRLQHVESQKPQVHVDFQNAVIAEVPDGRGSFQEIVVFGSYDDIQELALSLESKPDKIFNSIRPVAGSPEGAFYLNKPAPPTIDVPLSREEQKLQDRAQKMFPTQSRDTEPVTRAQEEARARKEHLNQFKSEASPEAPPEPPNSLVGDLSDAAEEVAQ